MAKLPITRTPAYIAFMYLVKSYYARCGSPQQTQIIRLASRLGEFYPPEKGDSEIEVSLSAPWLSQLLSGKLTPLPSADKFRAFILAVGRYGVEVGILEEEPDRSTLREWQELLRQTKNKAEQQARDGVFVDDEDTGGKADSPFSSEVGIAVPKARAPRHIVRAEPVVLSPTQLSHLMKYGAYAQTLAVRAAKGDPIAQYQEGVLFGCDAAYRDTAIALLKSAAAAGLEPALELWEAGVTGPLGPAALTHARQLADHYRRRDDDRAHATFRSCATQAWVCDGADRPPPRP
ncbi:hypothetical protein [Actinomadura rubrisoli]|uniref:Uncharacterized protein n=1 Tax=Actinomadura rubrisoli TaxID=2530368 RepID=A0A4R5C5Q7_9ACTN|nr:hypothetical protein [Actinomadura rubrisoli]TDD93350.1 hypothetical protein E1298_09845 [Actinomadura rubrisoli]